MKDYTVYRAGADQPVRVQSLADGSPRRGAAVRRRRGGRLKAVAVVVLLCAAAALVFRYHSRTFADASVTLGLLSHVRRLPHWSGDAVVAAAIAGVTLSACLLAFVRRRVFTAIAIVLLVALFATPGVALGWASSFVGHLGSGGTAEQRATVKSARSVLQTVLPNKPVNILLLGTDDANQNSDSQILLRLDPQAKTISMLSVPRDLYCNIPGLGQAKLNAAYPYGGIKLAIQVFRGITGVPINHFIRLDFSGFWKVIDLLHGVYLPIDHRYYNPEGNGFQPIDIQPGYQLVKAKQALNFVRFRHDQSGDFTRMVRQQLFLREVQRQAMRWSGSWTGTLKLIRALSGVMTTDLDSLGKLLPIVNMALSLNTSHIYQFHVQGGTQTIGGIDYVVATPTAISQAVHEFLNPKTGHHHSHAAAPKSASTSTSTSSSGASPSQSATKIYDLSGWQALQRRTSLPLEAPTVWPAGLQYDTAGVPFRAYSVRTTTGGTEKAAIAVGTAIGGAWNATEYWGVQALRWKDPPIIADPNERRTVDGRTYLLFYQDSALHLVAWQQGGVTYWVINTLDNALSNKTMLALAESCVPVPK